MRLQETSWSVLALALQAERKRQKLSREQAAAVCGVSTSFIRDAESHPELCSLGKLVLLTNGLGLSINLSGFNQHHMEPLSSADYGVREHQIVVASNVQPDAGEPT